MASTKREKELARQRAERQAARRAAAGHRRQQRNAVLASVLAVVLLTVGITAAGLALRGGDDPEGTLAADGTTQPRTAPSASSSPAASAAASPSGASTSPTASAPVGGDVACSYEETGETAAREVELPPTTGVETEQVYLVTLATARGDIVFEMDSAEAPCTANNLRSLAHFGFYDNTPCHRLTTEGIEVLQCGDPTGTGSGGPGYQFAEENLEGATYPRGTVAMAHGGPGTNGSQFFLVYGDSNLPPQYTPFGRVVKGLDVLDDVAAGGSDESYGSGDGKPTNAISIKTLRAKPKPA